MRSLIRSLLVLGLAGAGCGDDGQPEGSDGTTGDTTDGTGVVACMPGDEQACTCEDGAMGTQTCSVSGFGPCMCGAGSTTDMPGTDSSGGSLCGNGVVDGTEQCDDGDDDDTNDCSNDCVVHCGMMWETALPAPGSHNVSLAPDGNVAVFADGEVSTPMLWIYGPDGTEVSTASAAAALADGTVVRGHLDGDGSVLVLVGEPDGMGGMTSRLVKYGGDLSETWSVDLDPTLVIEDDFADIVVDADGNAVVTASINVGDGDDDVWVGQYSGADGSETWTSTFTGPLVAGFSTDRGGRVAVGSDGTAFVLAKIRKTFNQQDTTLLRFPAGGGMTEIEDILTVDPGSNQDQYPWSIAVNATDRVAIAASVFGNGVVDDRFDAAIYDGDTPAWTLTSSDEFDVGGQGLVEPAVAVDGDGGVMIAATNVVDVSDPRALELEAVVARYDADGNQTCVFQHPGPEGEYRGVLDALLLDDGTFIVVGYSGTVDWIARFRP